MAVALLIAITAPFWAMAQDGGGFLTRAELAIQKNAIAAAEFTAATAALGETIAVGAVPGAPVFDAGGYARGVVTVKYDVDQAAAKVAEVQTSIFEDALEVLEKVLYESLKKKILDMVVDQIIGYIQGEGTPRFITDWEGFFNDIVQGATGDLVKELGLGFLCAPFSLPVRLQIAASLVPVERFKAKFDCTLDQIVGNIDAFFDDFRNGGWKAYSLSWEPQNNYYGAIWLAWDEQQNRLANKLFSAANEVVSNQGWLGVRKCYDRVTGQEISSSLGAFGKSPEGADCTIITPGKALGSLAEKAIGSDIDFIVNSEDLSAYIAAITNALINRVIKEGVGLLGVSLPSAPQRIGTRDATGNIIFDNSNIPASVRGANTRYQNTLGTTKAAIKQQLELVRDARIAANNSMNQRLTLEDNYLVRLRVLRGCEERKFNPADQAATISQITSQLTVINDLQSRILANQDAITELDFNLRELAGSTEAEVVANLQHYQQLASSYTIALGLKQKTADELNTANATIPGLINAINAKIEQCNKER